MGENMTRLATLKKKKSPVMFKIWRALGELNPAVDCCKLMMTMQIFVIKILSTLDIIF